MNKIITIKLGGISINIEEDAYEYLRNYLLEVRAHFRDSENGKEILEDIESRIAEMLFEKLKDRSASASMEDVREVVRIMGNPDDFETEDENETFSSASNNSGQKRLFRDPDHAMLGGVCAGLAKYFGLDITLVRIAWIFLVLVFGTGILFYFILWAIIPKAVTAAERLQMSGEIPNIENIKRTFRQEAGQAYSSFKKKAQSDDARYALSRLESWIRGLGRFVLRIVSVVLLFSLIALLIVIATQFYSGSGFFSLIWNNNWSEQFEQVYGQTTSIWFIKLGLFGIILLPLVMVMVRIMAFLLDLPKPHINVRRGVWALWLICFFSAIGAIAYGTMQFRSSGEVRTMIPVQIDGDTLYLQTLIPEDQNLENPIRIRLDIAPTKGGSKLEMVRITRSYSQKQGEKMASNIEAAHLLNSDTLIITNNNTKKAEDVGYMPEIQYTLHLAHGQIIYLDPNTGLILRHAQNTGDLYGRYLAGNHYKMTSEGLQCLDCEVENYTSAAKGYSNMPLQSFDKLQVSAPFRVRIVESPDNYLELPAEPWAEYVKIVEEDDILTISLERELELLVKDKSQGMDQWIVLHCPGIRQIESSGAARIELTSCKNEKDLQVELNGATRFEAMSMDLDNLDIEANGAAYIELSGRATLFKLEASGATKVRSSDLITDYLKAEVNGASDCEVHVLRELEGTVNGAGKIRYKGDPKILQDVTGFSKIERW